jgi:hemerythrin superfamily protein
MSTDAIVVLREDHKQIRALFKQIQATGENAHKRHGELVGKVIEQLTAHTYIENEVLYPRVRALLPELEQEVLESYEEHHVADLLTVELMAMSPDDERFLAKTTVLIESVTHHIDEEEKEWFPQVRQALSRTQLREIGEQLIEAKKSAPRHPAKPSALKKTLDALIP